MTRGILYLNGSYCCRCNKSLSKTEVMECNGCHCMAYCSAACQREDWLNGHKLICCKPYTDESVGQFQGRVTPKTTPEDERTANKLKELEVNQTMIQLKLFLDNAEDILKQAQALELPLYDCLVKFDLRECPPTIDVVKYTDVYEKPEHIRKFEETRSKNNITCVYFSAFFYGEVEEELAMQKHYPHKWLMK
jgi:hypothetical protein